jgi:hypothetical protein
MQADSVFENQKLARNFSIIVLSVALMVFPIAGLLAGGGLVLEDDACILRVDFYSTHFTAYQPDTSGNEQFCESLPDKGATIFVLDYLHQSLKEVPVDFRIIRDVTELGRFVKLKHVEAIEDIEQHTVFYQTPVVQADASLQFEHNFAEEGAYIGIITAGHPTNEQTYTAVFPFEVGTANASYVVPVILFFAGISFLILFIRHRRSRSRVLPQETAIEAST